LSVEVALRVGSVWKLRRGLGWRALEGARGLEGGRSLEKSGTLRVGPVGGREGLSGYEASEAQKLFFCLRGQKCMRNWVPEMATKSGPKKGSTLDAMY